MAGEKEGFAVEALTCLALQDLGYELGDELHWGDKPEGFSIDPDFIIGSIEKPSYWILVTTSTSPNNSNMKFWRNAGELFATKRHFENSPRAIEIVLESNQEKGLITAATLLYDSAIRIDSHDWGVGLVDYVKANAKNLPANKELALSTVRKYVESDSVLTDALGEFRDALNLSMTSNSAAEELYALMQKTCLPARVPDARDTFLKRGLAKYLLFNEAERKKIHDEVATGTYTVKGNLPSFAEDLGIFEKTIAGWRLLDSELSWFVTAYTLDECEFLYVSTFDAAGQHWGEWVAEIREAKPCAYHTYVVDNYKKLTKKKSMQSLLDSHAKNGPKWLFWHLIEVFKLRSGKRQGYGFAVLAEDVGYKQGISQGYKYLADWANGVGGRELPTDLIPDVAAVFSKRLAEIPFEELEKMGAFIRQSSAQNLFQQKFVCYPYFEPIPILLERELSSLSISYERVNRHPSFIGELMNEEHKLTVSVYKVGDVLIHWKSGYDSGKHHKMKELSGKGPAIRYQSSSTGFSERDGVNRMLLVVDGTFSQAQLDAIASSCWSEVYYPDEIDELSKSLV